MLPLNNRQHEGFLFQSNTFNSNDSNDKQSVCHNLLTPNELRKKKIFGTGTLLQLVRSGATKTLKPVKIEKPPPLTHTISQKFDRYNVNNHSTMQKMRKYSYLKGAQNPGTSKVASIYSNTYNGSNTPDHETRRKGNVKSNKFFFAPPSSNAKVFTSGLIRNHPYSDVPPFPQKTYFSANHSHQLNSSQFHENAHNTKFIPIGQHITSPQIPRGGYDTKLNYQCKNQNPPGSRNPSVGGQKGLLGQNQRSMKSDDYPQRQHFADDGVLESNVLIGIDGSMQNSYWHYEASLFKCQDVTNTNGSAHLPANKNNIINPTPSPPVNVTNTNGCTHLQSANKNYFVDSTQSSPVDTTKESSDPNQYSDAIRLMGKLVGDNWDSLGQFGTALMMVPPTSAIPNHSS